MGHPQEEVMIPSGSVPLCWWCQRPAQDQGRWISFRGNPIPLCPECRNLGELAVSGLSMLSKMVKKGSAPR